MVIVILKTNVHGKGLLKQIDIDFNLLIFDKIVHVIFTKDTNIKANNDN